MQTQHLIFIATGSAIGFLLMAYFIRKAVLRAFARVAASHAVELNEHRVRIKALTNDIIRLSQLPKAESALTWADYQTLLQVHATLVLAQMTWRAMPGTESTQLTEQQAKKVMALANRISDTVPAGAAA